LVLTIHLSSIVAELCKGYPYDVFIAHAVEDKAEVTNELYTRLKEAGIKVWYSGEKLQVGGDLYQMIKDGLNKSRHGILILSPNFFRGSWPVREFHVLWGKKNARILPVWHNITKEEIERHDKLLAEFWAVNTDVGMDRVVQVLIRALKEPKRKQRWGMMIGFFFMFLLAAAGLWYLPDGDTPPGDLVRATIEQRISTLQKQVLITHTEVMQEEGATAATISEIKSLHNQYEGIESYYRNRYTVTTGKAEIHFRKNVEPTLKLDFNSFSLHNAYGFDMPNTFKIDHSLGKALDVKYIFLNTQPVSYHQDDPDELTEGECQIPVAYENYIRYLTVSLQYTKNTDWMKRRSFEFMALLPVEIYRFEKVGDDWVFKGVD